MGYARGAAAEEVVAEWLCGQGFAIVGRNLRLGYYELDIVARRGPLIVVVEVRTRGARSRTTGLSSIGKMKQRRIRAAGTRLWERRYRHDPSAMRMRFDVASVTFRATTGAQIEYVPAAF